MSLLVFLSHSHPSWLLTRSRTLPQQSPFQCLPALTSEPSATLDPPPSPSACTSRGRPLLVVWTMTLKKSKMEPGWDQPLWQGTGLEECKVFLWTYCLKCLQKLSLSCSNPVGSFWEIFSFANITYWWFRWTSFYWLPINQHYCPIWEVNLVAGEYIILAGNSIVHLVYQYFLWVCFYFPRKRSGKYWTIMCRDGGFDSLLGISQESP